MYIAAYMIQVKDLHCYTRSESQLVCAESVSYLYIKCHVLITSFERRKLLIQHLESWLVYNRKFHSR